MPATSAHTRRTSIYTVRLHGDEQAAFTLDQARDFLTTQGIGVADHGDRAISYRAADDAAAARIALDALDAAAVPWTLTTGLGIHRREVRA